MPGAVYALLAAASFGFQSVATRRGVLASSAWTGIYITVIGGVPLFLLAATLSGQLFKASRLSAEAILLLMVAGSVHYLVGRYSSYRAIGAMGSTRTAPFHALSAPYSVVMAMLLLGERVTPLMGVGIGLVLFAPVVMIQRSVQGSSAGAADSSDPGESASWAASGPGTRSRDRAAPPPLRLREGYLYGTLSSLAYGTTPIMIRAALRDTGLSLLGGLIAYSTAATLLLLSLGLPGRLASMRSTQGTAVRWFMLGGVTIFMAQMLWFLALGAVPVTVVAPIMRTAALYTVFFSFLINRRLESFGPRVMLGVFLAVAGSVMVALKS